MKGRVKFTPPSYTGMAIDWNELVDKPFKEGRIIEAFGSADAIIDGEIENALRQLYEEHKCQDLINELHLLRSKASFDGIVLLEILKSKTVVKEDFYQKVLNFKKARNLVLHNIQGEYALVLGNPSFKYSSQEQLDKLVEEQSKKWIAEAFNIFDNLYEINSGLTKTKNDYFTHDFYNKNPRGLVHSHKNKFPK